MDKPLHIVIVSYTDDNFGDNLIRIAFQALLEVALANHGVHENDVVISRMPLKSVDEKLIENADTVFFAGGGLFGKSYLGFYPHVDQITSIATRRGTPVVFSSMGLNNMDSDDGRTDSISEILTRDCVKSLSVRENLELFRRAASTTSLEVAQVADPAVWTKYVYGMNEVKPDGTLGINVVRGGLFVANDCAWGLTAEMDYLSGLRLLAEEAGIKSQLYTNGSLDDNNTLRYFQGERGLSIRDVITPTTTREVVEAIASRSMIASIRMHSSIIAYSFGIPTVALQWNDKLRHFYQAIGHPERLLTFDDWKAERAIEVLRNTGDEPDNNYEGYLMSTYDFIHQSVGTYVVKQGSCITPPTFDQVASALVGRSSRIDESEFDLRVKIDKAERAYLKRFIALRRSEREIRELKKANDAKAAQIVELNGRMVELESRFVEASKANASSRESATDAQAVSPADRTMPERQEKEVN